MLAKLPLGVSHIRLTCCLDWKVVVDERCIIFIYHIGKDFYNKIGVVGPSDVRDLFFAS